MHLKRSWPAKHPLDVPPGTRSALGRQREQPLDDVVQPLGDHVRRVEQSDMPPSNGWRTRPAAGPDRPCTSQECTATSAARPGSAPTRWQAQW